jgi:CO/xanthine dehydrogenase Mo-binding subunit
MGGRRSWIPHGRLKNWMYPKPGNLRGCGLFWTAEAIPALITRPGDPRLAPMVGIGARVRYLGDTVAIVAAETKAIAAAALDVIEAESDLLPVIQDPVRAKTETEALHGWALLST